MIDPKMFLENLQGLGQRFAGQMPEGFGFDGFSFDPSQMVQGNPMFRQWLTMQKAFLENWDRMLASVESSPLANPFGPVFDVMLAPFQQMTGMAGSAEGGGMSTNLVAAQRKILNRMRAMVDQALMEDPLEQPA